MPIWNSWSMQWRWALGSVEQKLHPFRLIQPRWNGYLCARWNVYPSLAWEFPTDFHLHVPLFAAAAALLPFHICQNVLSLHVVTRIASKGTDWGEMKCVFKCKGTVRWEKRGSLKGFRKMGFQAFLVVKDSFGVNYLKRRTFYFKKFIIHK